MAPNCCSRIGLNMIVCHESTTITCPKKNMHAQDFVRIREICVKNPVELITIPHCGTKTFLIFLNIHEFIKYATILTRLICKQIYVGVLFIIHDA